MKTTDFNQLAQVVENMLTYYKDTLPWSDDIPQNVISHYVMSIYMLNDITKAVGIDYVNKGCKISFLVAKNRVVCFIDNTKSYYLDDEEYLCQYQDLKQDVENILACMTVAYVRVLNE